MLLSLKDNIEKFKSSYAKLKILIEENSNNARENLMGYGAYLTVMTTINIAYKFSLQQI